MALNLDFNLGAESDRLFNELLGVHDGLSCEQSEQLNAGLILILMNHIGEPVVIREAIAHAVAMDIHPVANLNVTTHHAAAFDGDAAAKDAWMVHFMTRGLAAVEIMADHPDTGPFLHGAAPGLADCVLVPQLYNARRRGMDLAGMPRLAAIEAACLAHPAFAAAVPESVGP